MTAHRCQREPALLDALASGRWPAACEPELREHVEDCFECRELLVVAEALVMDRRAAEAEADVPTSGAVWWRMEMRREREEKEAAARTVGRVHAGVVSVTVALLVAALSTTPFVRSTWSWLTTALSASQELVGLASSVPLMLLALVGVTILVFAPVALYLAFARD